MKWLQMWLVFLVQRERRRMRQAHVESLVDVSRTRRAKAREEALRRPLWLRAAFIVERCGR